MYTQLLYGHFPSSQRLISGPKDLQQKLHRLPECYFYRMDVTLDVQPTVSQQSQLQLDIYLHNTTPNMKHPTSL